MLVRKDFDMAFQSVDCIATPTCPTPPFRQGEKTNDPLTMYLADIFTVPASLAGIPGISLPCGFVEKDGVALPVGMQLLGKHFDEKTILRAAYQYERATQWHTKKPDIKS